ncbi:DNA mismatch repair protein MutS2 [Clostridium cavendishii DSM 21758]|uniref:Endonuclease MutS2 n=1 Tax=Clostridium cavendishii DSM 21758 TaxID=1121302 RepID=A0A1M6KSN2_9CLOT|nr:endonuclease MutS2 [Clostridium cavendishii]SHJ61884.1 DNA mismatch repair protein MutS2 [Clostridium cavendishii DSM 21758]
MNEKALRVLEFNKIKEELKKYCVTSGGKQLVDALKPYDSAYEVKEHLNETREALALLTKKGNPPFEGLHDTTEAVVRAEKGGSLSPSQLLRIAQMLRASRRFIEYISRKDDEEEFYLIENLALGLTPIKKLEDNIFTAIISEEEISDKASQALYGIRRSLKEKNSSVRDKVNSIIRSNSKYLQDNLYTMRGDRYVIPVKAEYKSMVPGLVHDQSSTGATLFIEPMSLVNLNNEIKELFLKEKAEIERILQELSSAVYGSIVSVKQNSKIMLELDFIFAKGKHGSSIEGICPNVNEEGAFDIIQGRHPLIDRKKIVPSDVYLGREFTSLVVTGPNTGGKTVTLKTVGLLHIMGMSGLLIPAKENSTISFYEEVFVDIGDEQSIEQSLSTFSSHMTNIVEIMKVASSKSLVLFDELGAGTDPTEGAALAVSILETLRERSCKIVATTHYSELKGYALRTQGVENASVEFDVETLRPTYRLLIGIPGKSNAFEISRRLGLTNDIIDKAKNLISSETLEFEDLIQSLQDKSVKAEKDAREAERLKYEALKLKEKYSDKMEKIESVREKAYAEARRDAKQILREAKEESDEILKNMRELERMGISSDARRMLEEERSKLRNKMDTAESKLQKTVQNKGEEITKVTLGMDAFLPSLNQNVIIISMPDNKGEVQVEAGIMKIKAKLKDLRVSKSYKEEKKKAKREVKLNMKQVSSSVDLRGLDAEEACYVVDKYLDDAYVGGLGEVTVIHGNGTGILRKSINDMLKKHPHVKSYRLGAYGEGGSGVTMVTLK